MPSDDAVPTNDTPPIDEVAAVVGRERDAKDEEDSSDSETNASETPVVAANALPTEKAPADRIAAAESARQSQQVAEIGKADGKQKSPAEKALAAIQRLNTTRTKEGDASKKSDGAAEAANRIRQRGRQRDTVGTVGRSSRRHRVSGHRADATEIPTAKQLPADIAETAVEAAVEPAVESKTGPNKDHLIRQG